jgi:predicted unusual protein kinase regulating ubiquinone biosynthesis (AarF/ABC1/UbiB family)
MAEELDYRDEADHQRAFAAAYDGDERVRVPKVVASAPKALVSEWVTGRKLSDVITRGTQAERDHAAAQLSDFHYSASERTGLLHSDPHPGNFQILDDGRLMVLDYGAVARLPGGMPKPLSEMVRLALADRPDDLLQLLRDEGFVRTGSEIAAADALAYLAPFTEPLRTESFRFDRAWLQAQAGRVGDLRSPQFQTGRELNLPPHYLLIHRVTMGTLGVLCQLDADVPLRGIVARWQPWIFE